jgi:hypothetical protein
MEEIQLKIRCQLEELAPIGSMILVSARRDQPVIVVKDQSFTPSYLEDVETKQQEVEGLVQPATKTAIGKQITKLLYDKLYSVREPLDDLELILKKAAKQLNAAVNDFKLGSIRIAINTNNVEGVVSGISYTMALVDSNFAALHAKGYTQAQRDWFETAKAAINAGNVDQSGIVSERRILTQANKVTINDYWDELATIMMTGRLVFKKDPARRKDYTFTVLMHQVRAAMRHTGDLTVKALDDATGNPIAGADVKGKKKGLTELTKSVKLTGTDGMTRFKPLPVGEYDVFVTAPEYVQGTEPVTVVEGVVTEVVVRLRKSA